jgi:glycosyltransferase involved in cell wall biosynthesis
MKVTLIAHYLDESVGHGMDRYSLKLMQGLRGKGITVNSVSSPAVLLGPPKSFLDFFFYLPLRSILRLAPGDLFHFVAPQAGIAIPIVKRIFGKKVVTTIYDLHPFIDKGQKSSFPVRKALETAINSSDMLLVISSQTKRDILERFKVDANRIRVTLLAADGKFQPSAEKKKTEGKPRSGEHVFTVGYIGGFASYKNVPFLIRAYSIFEKSCKSPCRLLLYGKGPEYQGCIHLAKELGAKSVEFRGFADERDIVKIYNSFDVFVFPSTAEGFGLPIIEAQMCRVPVIVKDGAHVPEEVTAMCLKARDEEHLATLIEKIRSEGFVFSKEHLEYLKQFTWDDCIEKTIAAYEEVLKG